MFHHTVARHRVALAFRSAPHDRHGPHEDRFLEMLPQISEVIANCWAAFVRLVERGRIDIVYPTPLAQFAMRQVRGGRKVGGKLNVLDVSSSYAQRRKDFAMKTLDRFDKEKQEWKEVLVEDKHVGPAEIAAS